MNKRGRPFEPGNQIGCGRPRGSRNKRTLIGKELLDEHAEAVVRKALVLALKGDTTLLRLFLTYILPRPQDSPVATGPLPMATIEDREKTFTTVIDKVAAGNLSLDQSHDIVDLMAARCRLIQTEELEARVRKLEQLAPGQLQS